MEAPQADSLRRSRWSTLCPRCVSTHNLVGERQRFQPTTLMNHPPVRDISYPTYSAAPPLACISMTTLPNLRAATFTSATSATSATSVTSAPLATLFAAG